MSAGSVAVGGGSGNRQGSISLFSVLVFEFIEVEAAIAATAA